MPDTNDLVENLLTAHYHVIMASPGYSIYSEKLSLLRNIIKDKLKDIDTSQRNFCGKHTDQKFSKCPVCYGQEIREERDKLKKLLPMNNMNTDYNIDYNLVENEIYLKSSGYKTKIEDGKLWYTKDPSTGWIYYVK